MRTTILILTLAALALAPAAGAEILVDHDESADFSGYLTYGWLGGGAAPNPLMETRIRVAVATELETHGLTFDEKEPDLYVVTHVATHDEKRLEVDSYGYAGGLRWRGWSAWGPTTVNVRSVEVGTLIVDLVDGVSRELVWRGIAQDTVPKKPEKVQKKLGKVLAKMFKDFPPS